MLVYGKNVAERILKDENLEKKIKVIYTDSIFYEKNSNLFRKIANSKIKIVENRKLDDLAKGVHQGIIIDMEEYQYTNLDEFLRKDNKSVIILDHILDPHNLGAIIRTAVAASFDAVIIPKDRQALVNATVVKTSVGAIYDIDVIAVTNINRCIDQLKQHDYWIYGSSLDGVSYDTVDYDRKVALIIGNEEKGMSKLVKDNSDFLIRIPISSKIDSLNASVAAGIMMFEVVQSRK